MDIIINKALLQPSNLDENSLFQIVADPNSGITNQSLRPSDEELFEKVMEKSLKKYAKTLSGQMKFLTVKMVINLHERVIQQSGGLGGIRDLGLLLSALEMPKATMFGEDLHKTVYDKASAYLYHIVCNRPFIDANMRTGMMSAIIFLGINEVDINVNQRKLEDLVVETAKGNIQKAVIARFLEGPTKSMF